MPEILADHVDQDHHDLRDQAERADEGEQVRETVRPFWMSASTYRPCIVARTSALPPSARIASVTARVSVLYAARSSAGSV